MDELNLTKVQEEDLHAAGDSCLQASLPPSVSSGRWLTTDAKGRVKAGASMG